MGGLAIGGGAINDLGAVWGSNMLIVFFRGAMLSPDEPFRIKSGGGPSPNSAISDRYSSSIFALLPAAWGPPNPGRFCLQSLEM